MPDFNTCLLKLLSLPIQQQLALLFLFVGTFFALGLILGPDLPICNLAMMQSRTSGALRSRHEKRKARERRAGARGKQVTLRASLNPLDKS